MTYTKRIWIYFFVTIIYLNTMTGCAITKNFTAMDIDPNTNISENNVIFRPAPKIECAQKAINQFALPAMLALLSYRDEVLEDWRNKADCPYNPEEFDKPDIIFVGKRGDWLRLPTILRVSSNEIKTCVNDAGLSFEVYAHRPFCTAASECKPEKYDEAIIAFRGTELNTRLSLLDDMYANTRSSTGKYPDDYSRISTHLRPLIDALKQEHPGIKIHATGHSLGGGLAQHAGYLFTEIEEVYAFNSSPITNWSYLVTTGTLVNPKPKIYRINQRGELLAPSREIGSMLDGTHPERVDFVFNFRHAASIDAHRMPILACNMASKIDEFAHHDFPKTSAHTLITKPINWRGHETMLCPPGSFFSTPIQCPDSYSNSCKQSD